MKVNRDERIAKAQGLTILGLMALVAFTIHFWPRTPALVMTPQPIVNAPSPAATNSPLAYRAPKRLPAPARRPTPPAVAPRSASPSPLRIVPLASVPGAQVALSSVPEAPVSSRAVTRAMQTTGKSLTGAFKKTGTAFRRAF